MGVNYRRFSHLLLCQPLDRQVFADSVSPVRRFSGSRRPPAPADDRSVCDRGTVADRVELCDQAVSVLSRRAARLEAAGRGLAVSEDWQKLLPLLVHIQAHLDGDLSLAALSRKAGLSPSYFHRLFKAAIGETPGDYVMRLRVERGAFRLLLHDARLVDVALDCGFQNHETFIRAFRRVLGKTPSEYREWIRRQVFERNHRAREVSVSIV